MMSERDLPRTRIKICGVRSRAIAEVAVEAGADAVGLVFAPGSPRQIDPEAAREIVGSLPRTMPAIAVFRSAPVEEVLATPTTAVQLHGDEDEMFVNRVHGDHRIDVIIRAIAFSASEVRRWSACDAIDALLIEGASPGQGERFAHEELVALLPEISKPVILAGGLTPQNAGAAIQLVRPWAVDVSSGVESSPGVKEPSLIREFCAAVRESDAQVG